MLKLIQLYTIVPFFISSFSQYKNEFQFNKQLLKEINQKLKTGSVRDGSNAGDQ